jgi:Flp pilus assembly protein TadD
LANSAVCATLPRMPRRPTALELIGLRFEVTLAEENARAHPDDLDAIRGLAYAYTAAGRLTEALEADLRLVARDPKRAEFRYDLACSYALLERKDEAFAELSLALDLGFSDPEHFDEDPDLEILRTDARWPAIRARVGAGGDGADAN